MLNKALNVAQNRGMDMGEHFNQVVEMVKLGSGTFREVDNFHLSRLACLIIAENADTVTRSLFLYKMGRANITVDSP